ncbi:class I SAM-dependent methyltransferase [Pseudoalteromonas sp.]|uniref:class I SAM-dependent methyltransferase n=1 Tax=Pseudoalteromonas sp. TaxID=53249 RepID=UPI001BCD1637|nr:class I SAM-dependent methyltransferase [Pseudoalteromonas sp.]
MHWDQYWDATTSLSSFAELNNQFGYPDEVLLFWEKIILKQNKTTIKILDLATGRGALAIWLQVVCDKHGIDAEIYACDFAKIDISSIKSDDKQVLAAISKINFAFSTGLESLHYDDDFFDLVVSQFGFEYSNWAESLAQVHRVLKPHAALVFMMHHHQSAIAINSAAGLSVFESVIKTGVFTTLQDAITEKLAGNEAQFTHLNQQAITKLNALKIDQDDELEWFLDLVNHIASIMKTINTHSEDKLLRLKTNVDHQVMRLSEQTSVSYTKKQINERIACSHSQIEVVDLTQCIVENHPFAWVLSAKI